MTEVTIKLPQVLKVENKTERAVAFVPYKENFKATLAAGKAMEFEVKTAGQVLYYLEQTEITVTQLTQFSVASDENTAIYKLPAKMVITNTSDKVKSFLPYKETFQVNVQAGDVYNVEADTLGQILYYLGQATDGLTVEDAELNKG